MSGGDGNLVFDLVVFNESSRKLIVKPSDFYYLSLDIPDDDSSRYHQRMAVAPVQVYKWCDRALEERESEKTLNTIMGFVEAGVGILVCLPDTASKQIISETQIRL